MCVPVVSNIAREPIAVCIPEIENGARQPRTARTGAADIDAIAMPGNQLNCKPVMIGIIEDSKIDSSGEGTVHRKLPGSRRILPIIVSHIPPGTRFLPP